MQSAADWLKQVDSCAGAKAAQLRKALVGTKSDLGAQQPQVLEANREQARKLAAADLETQVSAESGAGVSEAIVALVKAVLVKTVKVDPSELELVQDEQKS